jgi:hypothetical protein
MLASERYLLRVRATMIYLVSQLPKLRVPHGTFLLVKIATMELMSGLRVLGFCAKLEKVSEVGCLLASLSVPSVPPSTLRHYG